MREQPLETTSLADLHRSTIRFVLWAIGLSNYFTYYLVIYSFKGTDIITVDQGILHCHAIEAARCITYAPQGVPLFVTKLPLE